MLTVPHLDREFDYLVSAEQSDDAQPGVRVRVRFHGRLVDAFVLERRSDTDHVGKLGALDRVVSAEPVLTTDVRRLVDAVAARYAGTRADVLRLAVPPRHANVEKQATPEPAPLAVKPVDAAAWSAYGRGEQFLAALGDGRAARAVWQALPGEQWTDRLAEAAAVTVNSGRGALAILPDQRDVDALYASAIRLVDEERVVALSAGLGPAQRYRRWLSVLRGSARVVIGTAAPCSRPSPTSAWSWCGTTATTPSLNPAPPIRTPVRWRCFAPTSCGARRSSAAMPAPPRRTPWCAAGGRTTSSRPAIRLLAQFRMLQGSGETRFYFASTMRNDAQPGSIQKCVLVEEGAVQSGNQTISVCELPPESGVATASSGPYPIELATHALLLLYRKKRRKQSSSCGDQQSRSHGGNRNA